MKVNCPYCGEEIVDADDEYVSNNYYASQEWIEEKIDIHLFGQGYIEPECPIVWDNNL